MKVFGQKPTPSAWFGLVVVGIFLFVAVFTPWLVPYLESANVGGTWDEPSGCTGGGVATVDVHLVPQNGIAGPQRINFAVPLRPRPGPAARRTGLAAPSPGCCHRP